MNEYTLTVLRDTLANLNSAVNSNMFRLHYTDDDIRLESDNGLIAMVAHDEYLYMDYYMRAMIKGIAIGINLMAQNR